MAFGRYVRLEILPDWSGMALNIFVFIFDFVHLTVSPCDQMSVSREWCFETKASASHRNSARPRHRPHERLSKFTFDFVVHEEDIMTRSFPGVLSGKLVLYSEMDQ